MVDDEVIENGVIIINENRIERYWKARRSFTFLRDAKVYDVNGKTIMPGIVDAHAHIGGLGMD